MIRRAVLFLFLSICTLNSPLRAKNHCALSFVNVYTRDVSCLSNSFYGSGVFVQAIFDEDALFSTGDYEIVYELLNSSLVVVRRQTIGVFENVLPGNYEIRASVVRRNHDKGLMEFSNIEADPIESPCRINTSVVVTEGSPLSLTIEEVGASRGCVDHSGTVTAAYSGGLQPITFTIPELGLSSDKPEFTGLPEGAFSLVLFDSAGCSVRAKFIIGRNEKCDSKLYNMWSRGGSEGVAVLLITVLIMIIVTKFAKSKFSPPKNELLFIAEAKAASIALTRARRERRDKQAMKELHELKKKKHREKKKSSKKPKEKEIKKETSPQVKLQLNAEQSVPVANSDSHTHIQSQILSHSLSPSLTNILPNQADSVIPNIAPTLSLEGCSLADVSPALWESFPVNVYDDLQLLGEENDPFPGLSVAVPNTIIARSIAILTNTFLRNNSFPCRLPDSYHPTLNSNAIHSQSEVFRPRRLADVASLTSTPIATSVFEIPPLSQSIALTSSPRPIQDGQSFSSPNPRQIRITQISETSETSEQTSSSL